MAQNTVVKMVVEALSKYGFKANGAYVNWGKTCSDSDKGKVVPGGEYEFEVFTAESGKQYVNKIVNIAKPAAAAKPDTERAKKFTPAPVKAVLSDDKMSKDEWAAKDTRISRQGLIQAAVQAVARGVAVELIFTEAEKLADQMLAYVNQK